MDTFFHWITSENGIKTAIVIFGSLWLWGMVVFLKKFIRQYRQQTAKKNFADPKYVIGAAIVNMERAVLYDDDHHFKFFIRYAIRACLKLPTSYPPDEPPLEVITQALSSYDAIPEELTSKIIYFYTLETLPDTPKECLELKKEVAHTVRQLFAFTHSEKETGA